MENTISRKDALKNMGLVALGMGLLPLSSCNNSEKSGEKTEKENKALSPFYVPPPTNPLADQYGLIL